MRTAVAIVVLLVTTAYAQGTGSYGTPIMCSASSATTYNFPSPLVTLTGSFSVMATCSGSAASTGSWTLDLFVGTQAAMNGFSSISFSSTTTVVGGFKITATAGVKVVVTIATPDIHTFAGSIWASIATSVTAQAGWVQLDASGNAQFVVPAWVSNVNSLQATFTIDASASTSSVVNTYALSAVALSVPNIAFDVSFAIAANANQTFVFTDSNTKIFLRTWASAKLMAHKSAMATSPAAPKSLGTAANVFWTVNLYKQDGTTQYPNGQFNGQITYTFSAADLPSGVTASMITSANLKLAYYDTTTSSWTFPAGGSTVSGSTITTATTHFSEWGMYYTGAANVLNANFLLIALAVLFAVMSA